MSPGRRGRGWTSLAWAAHELGMGIPGPPTQLCPWVFRKLDENGPHLMGLLETQGEGRAGAFCHHHHRHPRQRASPRQQVRE